MHVFQDPFLIDLIQESEHLYRAYVSRQWTCDYETLLHEQEFNPTRENSPTAQSPH